MHSLVNDLYHKHITGPSFTSAQKSNGPPEIYITSWWLNQPLWKICSSKREPSPNTSENKTYLNCHHHSPPRSLVVEPSWEHIRPNQKKCKPTNQPSKTHRANHPTLFVHVVFLCFFEPPVSPKTGSFLFLRRFKDPLKFKAWRIFATGVTDVVWIHRLDGPKTL